MTTFGKPGQGLFSVEIEKTAGFVLLKPDRFAYHEDTKTQKIGVCRGKAFPRARFDGNVP